MKDEEIRIKILGILYAYHRDNPLNFLRTEVLIDEIGNEESVLWQLNYLLDGGYIEGKRFKTFESMGYLEKVKITAKGINIVEPPSRCSAKPGNVQADIMMGNFILRVIEEIEGADISTDKKKELLEEVNNFLTDPCIAPYVGAALVKLLTPAS